MSSNVTPRSFVRLAVGTAVAGYLLIVFGGTVRVTGAGMGCGPDWPLCNGRVIPELDVLAWIEFIHRLIALSIILLTGALGVTGWRLRHVNRWFARLPLLAVGLVLVQALLGAVTVFTHTDALMVTIHLGVGLSYFAVTLALALLVVAPRLLDRPRTVAASRLQPWVLAATGGVFALMLTGAYTAKSGASFACPEWPFCRGYWVPTGWGIIDVHLTHRLTAVVATVLVVLAAIAARRVRGDAPPVVMLGYAIAGLMAVEIIVGAGNIWFTLASWVRIAHLAVAALIWGLLVLLVLLDRLLPSSVPAVPYRPARGAKVFAE